MLSGGRIGRALLEGSRRVRFGRSGFSRSRCRGRGCSRGRHGSDRGRGSGPLGQGITNAVGMAMAEKLLANEFNKPGHEIVNHHTYVFLGDGCMMEGTSHEACAIAS